MTENNQESTEQPASEQPSTALELAQKVDWLRAQLDTVRADAERAAMVRARELSPLDDWVRVLADYDQLGQALARTEFVPKDFRGKPESVTAAMMFGREIGLPPLTTLQNTHVINGRVGMYAEQLRAMILAAGHEYVIDESTSDRCVISACRKGSTRWQTHTYTMDQAKLAGLWAQNDQYKKRPVEMLLARASGIMAHAQFPDVIRGMGALEELEISEPDAPPAAEAVKPTTTVGRKPRATKAIEPKVTPAPASDARFTVPDEAALPPLPGEEVPPAAVTDPPVRSTETEVSAARAGVEEHADEIADPVPPVVDRHCVDYLPHEPHRWADEHGTWACSGVLPDPARDDPAPSGPLPSGPKPISPADHRLLMARFRALGYTDEPDDREARLAVAAALAGRDEVTTFRAGQADSLTKPEAQAILIGLAECRNRDDVLELMVRRSQDAAAEESQQGPDGVEP